MPCLCRTTANICHRVMLYDKLKENNRNGDTADRGGFYAYVVSHAPRRARHGSLVW